MKTNQVLVGLLLLWLWARSKEAPRPTPAELQHPGIP
jgi:hypothetical protein